MTYVLHYAPDNASMVIRLALEHARLPYRTQLVDRAAQGQRDPSYLALNPNGLIPVLETPHSVLFETGAILLWLSDTHGGLGPQVGDAERADYLKWLFFTANTLHPALRIMFYADTYIGTDTAHQSALRAGMEHRISEAFARLDEVAAQKPVWFGAAEPTGLDFYVACALRWCALYPADRAHDWFDLAATPALARMCAYLETLPCTLAAQTSEGLGQSPFTNPTYANPPHGSAT